jgi:hypothetical protein
MGSNWAVLHLSRRKYPQSPPERVVGYYSPCANGHSTDRASAAIGRTRWPETCPTSHRSFKLSVQLVVVGTTSVSVAKSPRMTGPDDIEDLIQWQGDPCAGAPAACSWFRTARNSQGILQFSSKVGFGSARIERAGHAPTDERNVAGGNVRIVNFAQAIPMLRTMETLPSTIPTEGQTCPSASWWTQRPGR